MENKPVKCGSLLVDGHVHYHRCYDPVEFLESAHANFRSAAEEVGSQKDSIGYLLLAEIAGEQYFQELRNISRGQRLGRWCFKSTSEDCSLLGCRDGEVRLIIVAGRQIACLEGIELLALCCTQEFPDGLPLHESLAAICECEAIPILPWGFGKWWLRRSAVVTELLELLRSQKPGQDHEVFLGDNAGRPHFSCEPRLFKAATRQGMRILPGSDPLPFRSQTANAGRYGFILPGTLDPDKPARSVKNLLRQTTAQPPCYGRREKLTNFIRYQVAMQFRKRIGKARR